MIDLYMILIVNLYNIMTNNNNNESSDYNDHNESLIEAVICGNPTSNLTNLNQLFYFGSAPAVTTYQSTAQVTCTNGWKWTDGTFGPKAMSCGANALWSFAGTCACINLPHCFD